MARPATTRTVDGVNRVDVASRLPDRPLRVALVSSAHALSALILVQAVLAGQHLFGSWSITAHGVIGNVGFVLALVVLATSVLLKLDRVVVGLAALLALLVTAQIGLGYSGRESLDAAAWHVPNGVLSFGVAVFLSTRVASTR